MYLHIKIRRNRRSMSIYEKREDFPFSIVKIHFLYSNNALNIFSPSFGADILRTVKTLVHLMNLIPF